MTNAQLASIAAFVPRRRTSAATEVATLQNLKFDGADTAEWRAVCALQHNAILEGPRAVTDTLLRFLQPYLRTPAIWQDARSPLTLPVDGCPALVLRNVSALNKQ